MTFSDETVMAYADGELEPQLRAELELAMAHDPQLARRVAAQRALRERLQRAFEPELDEPVPEQLLNAVRGATSSTVAPLRGARGTRTTWSWPQWSALAASFVLGAVLGPLLPGPSSTISTRDGQLLASGRLSRALSQQLASDASPASPVHIGLSFRTRDGTYCRSFLLRGSSALAGVACRDQGEWRLQVLAGTALGAAPEGAYRPAAAAMPAAVTQAVDALITGEPLDGPAEAAARDRGWRR